jgi:diguanylate cyclase (GGDEF)-like protein
VNDSTSEQGFRFEQASPDAGAHGAPESPAVAFSGTDMERSLNASSIVSYAWDITTDRLSWSGNASAILTCPTAQVSTGKSFAMFLDGDNMTTRFDAVMNSKARDTGDGIPFRIEYQFKPEGRSSLRSLWFEDTGRWFAGQDGRPVRVYGTLRCVDERQQQEQALNLASTSDPLTGAINRARMTDMLGEAISNSLREHSSCAFAIASISNLAIINEAYGFEIADEVISHVATRLKQVMRSGDVIARYSNSKFGFVLNNCSPVDLEKAGDRFLAVVRESVIETSKGPVWAILSMGAVSIPESTQDSAAAIAYSEEALNEARAMPADACVIYKFSEALKLKQSLNARCASEIVACLKEGAFKLAYQPILDAKTGETVMHEALLRMEDQTGELIPAGHLIPIAEHIGLIRLIDRCVVQMAVTALHSYPHAKISVNISASSAMDGRWNTQLIELLGADPSIAKRVTVEVTEKVAFSDLDVARKFIASLQAIGCAVAIDDFGAGYTSFRNVHGMNFNMVKLDGTFCRGLKDSAEARFYAKSLIDLGKHFGLKTIAEWVESSEDAEELKALGIDLMQGRFLGEASIVPPWQSSASAAFAMDGAAPVPTWDEEPADLVVAEEVTAEPAAAPQPEPEPQSEPEFEPVLESSEYSYDDGISKLQATLALLRDGFKPSEDVPYAEAS